MVSKDSAITDAQQHFSLQYPNGKGSEAVYYQFAITELEFDDLRAKGFVALAKDPSTEEIGIYGAEFNDFYLWYYMNYMMTERSDIIFRDILWSAEWRNIKTTDSFDYLTIQALKLVTNGQNTEWVICTNDEAELWSVFVHVPLKGLLCMADCRHQQVAVRLLEALELLIRHWQIKLLINIKDADVNNLFSTHRLKVAMIDRDTLESAETKDNLLRLIRLPANAESGSFHLVVEGEEDEDNQVKAALQRANF